MLNGLTQQRKKMKIRYKYTDLSIDKNQTLLGKSYMGQTPQFLPKVVLGLKFAFLSHILDIPKFFSGYRIGCPEKIKVLKIFTEC